MEETKKALPTGQVESAEGCAGARIEGGKELDPQEELYHTNDDSSILKKRFFKYGMGIVEKNCARCGKVYIPTRPEYAWGECCSYTCCLRYEEEREEALNNARAVMMLHPHTMTDILIFESAKAAAEFANVSPKGIRNACNGVSVVSGGYGWRWADEEPLRLDDIIQSYKEEPKMGVTLRIRESAYRKIKAIAKKRGISRNQVAAEILENELQKEEYYRYENH